MLLLSFFFDDFLFRSFFLLAATGRCVASIHVCPCSMGAISGARFVLSDGVLFCLQFYKQSSSSCGLRVSKPRSLAHLFYADSVCKEGFYSEMTQKRVKCYELHILINFFIIIAVGRIWIQTKNYRRAPRMAMTVWRW